MMLAFLLTAKRMIGKQRQVGVRVRRYNADTETQKYDSP
jgi:hypothetical protein